MRESAVPFVKHLK